jgi:hypothetical protein
VTVIFNYCALVGLLSYAVRVGFRRNLGLIVVVRGAGGAFGKVAPVPPKAPVNQAARYSEIGS